MNPKSLSRMVDVEIFRFHAIVNSDLPIFMFHADMFSHNIRCHQQGAIWRIARGSHRCHLTWYGVLWRSICSKELMPMEFPDGKHLYTSGVLAIG